MTEWGAKPTRSTKGHPLRTGTLPVHALGPGLYFLWLHNKLQYVGQSKRALVRIAKHIEQGAKEFDGVTFMPVAPDRLDEMERRYIAEYRPPLNVILYGATSLPAPDAEEMAYAAVPVPAARPVKVLRTAEAAALLSVSPRTLEGWRIVGGGPPFVKLGTRAVRYREDDLLAFVAQHGPLLNTGMNPH